MNRTLLRRRVVGALPITLDLWMKARRGYRVAAVRPIELDRLRLLREASDETLGDSEQVQELLARLGLSGDRPDYFPAELQPALGTGLRHWQYPVQFAPYLCAIGQLGVTSYLEVGVQHGGTFLITTEYLKRRGRQPIRARAVDLRIAPSVAEYALSEPLVDVAQMNSSSPWFRKWMRRNGPFDLALIDGDHSYEGCMADFEAIEPHVRSIAFHDISNGREWEVDRVWHDVRKRCSRWKFAEFTAQYPAVTERVGHNLLGIGLMVRD